MFQAARYDNDAAQVISNISSQLNGENLTPEQEALVQHQLLQQEGLELQHLEQLRRAERALEEELAAQQQRLDDQIREQQKLVSGA